MEGDCDIYELLTLQLAEIEMLQSMFPQPGELELDDPLVVGIMQTFVEERKPVDTLNDRISFTLNIDVGEEDKKVIS